MHGLIKTKIDHYARCDNSSMPKGENARSEKIRDEITYELDRLNSLVDGMRI